MKTLQNILAIICLVALVCAGAENPDGSCILHWSIPCLATCFLAGYAFKLTFKDEENDAKR